MHRYDRGGLSHPQKQDQQPQRERRERLPADYMNNRQIVDLAMSENPAYQQEVATFPTVKEQLAQFGVHDFSHAAVESQQTALRNYNYDAIRKQMVSELRKLPQEQQRRAANTYSRQLTELRNRVDGMRRLIAVEKDTGSMVQAIRKETWSDSMRNTDVYAAMKYAQAWSQHTEKTADHVLPPDSFGEDVVATRERITTKDGTVILKLIATITESGVDWRMEPEVVLHQIRKEDGRARYVHQDRFGGVKIHAAVTDGPYKDTKQWIALPDSDFPGTRGTVGRANVQQRAQEQLGGSPKCDGVSGKHISYSRGGEAIAFTNEGRNTHYSVYVQENFFAK